MSIKPLSYERTSTPEPDSKDDVSYYKPIMETSNAYSVTTCALIGSNFVDLTMFDAFGDADNDGIINSNDLDNAGKFMPFLVKTHESTTNAFFRLEFDETKIKNWTEDSDSMITRLRCDVQERGSSHAKVVRTFVQSNLIDYHRFDLQAKNRADILLYCHANYEIVPVSSNKKLLSEN